MSLPCGTLVEITGSITDSGLCVESVKVVHKPIREELACLEKTPDNPIEYSTKYYLYIRRPEIIRIVKTYFHVVDYARRFLINQGFIELPVVITGSSSDPGLRGASKISIELYGNKVELQSSVIMYKQLYTSIFEKVFYVAKNIRLEPMENLFTGRHLLEFSQIDIECTDVKPGDLMALAEKLLYKVIKYIVEEHQELLESREVERLEREIQRPPYPRLTYEEAIEEARSLGFTLQRGQELSFTAEAAIADKHGSPIWVTGFPSETRGFYYLEDPGKPGFNLDYNLLLPSGHGEVLDGGCREYRYERIVERITKRHGENTAKYGWFLEMASAGLIRPTCGWGLGVERLVKYIHNLKHVVYATPHPRLPGVVSP